MPLAGQYPGRRFGKEPGINPAVVGNRHAGTGKMLLQICAVAPGSLGYGIDVHTIGAGAQLSPQPAGTKLQIPGKTGL